MAVGFTMGRWATISDEVLCGVSEREEMRVETVNGTILSDDYALVDRSGVAAMLAEARVNSPHLAIGSIAPRTLRTIFREIERAPWAQRDPETGYLVVMASSCFHYVTHYREEAKAAHDYRAYGATGGRGHRKATSVSSGTPPGLR
jgi:hypothetical protein